MWGSSEEPPGTMEAGPPKSVANAKETCEQKNQLETVKDIMLRNKQSLKKKEEELQEYAKKLTKFKTRKPSRAVKDNASSSSESTPNSKSELSISEPTNDIVDEISQAKTPKAKSSLLQKKLAEDRKIFEQRSKELTESKRAVEEKVEALRQQLEETYVAPVNPVLITSQTAHSVLELSSIQDKDNRIKELNNKILELEATIIDLQDNLKEKDSVIDSKTKAITLMSADLSKKGKTTLDNLEDTKDEMRSMQQNFVLIEGSLKSKNDNLLKQLEERADQVSKLEEMVESLTEKLETQKQADTLNADYSRSTMESLAETKDAMKSMQENFVLIESSLKTKNEHLLKQLEEREIKLAEAEARILNYETGVGIQRPPDLDDLLYKIEKMEKTNHDLQDEKYELQKSIAELQDKIIAGQVEKVDDSVTQKDNRITELEALIEELKASDEALKEKLKAELELFNEKNEDMSKKLLDFEKQVEALASEKAELSEKLSARESEATKSDDTLENKVSDLEKQVEALISEKAELAEKLSARESEATKSDDALETKVSDLEKQVEALASEKAELTEKLSLRENKATEYNEKLEKITKELDESNKSMIKLKAQHKTKLKNQQKQLENFKKVSDANAELVRLGNEVALLEEEKASTAELKEHATDLEGKVSTQAKEIEAHIQSIAILENQKLDLMQELHAVKQEVSDLEAENAESDNARVSAEMKVVELEEQLETLHRLGDQQQQRAEELQRQLDSLTRENERLGHKVAQLEELKSSSESFEALATEDGKADLLRKVDELTRENAALTEKLARFEEKAASSSEDSAASSESFERIAPSGESRAQTKDDKSEQKSEELEELQRKIEQLESENRVLVEQSTRMDALKEQLDASIAELERRASEQIESENRALAEQATIREQLDAAIQELERRATGQSETIAAQEAMLNELREQLRVRDEETQAKNAQLQNEVAEAEETRRRLTALEAQLRQRDAELLALAEQAATLSSESELADERLLTTRRQLTDLQSRLERSKSAEEWTEAQGKLAEREERVAELESLLAQRLSELGESRERADGLQAENDRLRGRLGEAERRAAELLQSRESQKEASRDAELAKAALQQRLLELQAVHEESSRHAGDLGQELADAYRMLERLKSKHTEDTRMASRRLEDLLEELQSRDQEVAALKAELDGRCVPESARADLERRLAEAEERVHAQLEKMKKYAAVARKKSAQCEELEGRLKEVEAGLGLEKSEKEDSQAREKQMGGRIVELERQLEAARAERDRAYESLSAIEEQMRELTEAKDNARELGVRMQVVEAKYVEQLTEINSLKTNNGMLLSKQAQINERLENVEKESEERRLLLEKLEKDKEIEEGRRAESASRLQELEAKLHERDAEIENLDNELHNYIDNLVQMQENLRLTSVSAESQATLQQSYDELSAQYNALSASSDETRARHDALIRENDELSERVARMQELNAAMQERIEAAESELAKDAEAAASLDDLNARYSELLRQLDSQQAELEATRLRLHEALASNESSEHQLRARISLLEQEKHNLARELEEAKSVAETPALPIVVESLLQEEPEGWGFDDSSTTLGLKAAEPQQVAIEESQKAETAPALFDASVFGASPPGNDSLDQLLQSARLAEPQPTVNPELEQLRSTVASLEAALAEQTRLGDEARTLRAELEQAQQAVLERDSRLDEITRQIERLTHDRSELERAIDVSLTNIGVPLDASSASVVEKLGQLGHWVTQILQELQSLKASNEQLSAAEEVCKNRALELDNQLRAASESTRIAELEDRIARTIGEKDLLQLQLNDATRSFDDYKAEFQQQLDTVTLDRNQLKAQLATMEPKQVVEETAPAPESVAEQQSSANALASMWDDDEEDPWGFNERHSAKEDHVHIPVVPSAELQLKVKLDELEEKLAELNEENNKLREEGKIAQLKNVKYVKKLKEYKVQLDNIQRQLKSQSSLGGFGADLDSAIEEELKSQIAVLEKALSEAKEDAQKLVAEKENLLRRVDVLTASTERFTEAKEKQDMEVHIWQMRYKEVEMKLRQLETPTEGQESPVAPSNETPASTANDNEMKELRENVEALAAENEELQQLLEEQRSQRKSSLDEKQAAVLELTANNAKLKSEYEALRKQYEQSLMDANEQVQNTREGFEVARKELAARCEQLEKQLNAALEERAQLQAQVTELQAESQRTSALNEKLQQSQEQLNAALEERAQLQAQVVELQTELQQTNALKGELQQSQSTLEDKIKGLELSIEEYTEQVHEKDALIQSLQEKLDDANSRLQQKSSENVPQAQSDVPVFTFASDNDEKEIENLRAQLQMKEAEIEHLSYSLNEGSMTKMVQEMQDNINALYNDKAELETRLAEKEALIEQLKVQESKTDGEGAKISEEDGRVEKLGRELQEREHDLEQLRAQLHQMSSNYEHTDDQLRNELLDKQQQLQNLQFTVSELQSEVANLRALEGLAAEDRVTIERLASEKEEIRRQAEESIATLLQQKEEEIGVLKDSLASERQGLLEALGLRDQELERLKNDLEALSLERSTSVDETTQHVARLEAELSESEHRLAELSISKDTDIQKLNLALSETSARLEELATMSEEEQRQLIELRQVLHVKEQQINGLQQQLQEKTKEYELIQHALQRHVGQTEHSAEVQQQLQQSAISTESLDSSSANELDVALYMLHQRDVRCEELTLELMQLLEERDTLQLRLSNAIRVNEELRKYAANAAANSSPTKESSTPTTPAVEDPSPSKSEGPVEIAKEAINSPIGEDKKALAQKLSQLKSVHHTKDVRLRDDRELRYTQQMSLLAHKDALNTLPPEAAARLVNANYTVSRDVQSQSSTLLNWLWGKSTPKVVHM